MGAESVRARLKSRPKLPLTDKQRKAIEAKADRLFTQRRLALIRQSRSEADEKPDTGKHAELSAEWFLLSGILENDRLAREAKEREEERRRRLAGECGRLAQLQQQQSEAERTLRGLKDELWRRKGQPEYESKYKEAYEEVKARHFEVSRFKWEASHSEPWPASERDEARYRAEQWARIYCAEWWLARESRAGRSGRAGKDKVSVGEEPAPWPWPFVCKHPWWTVLIVFVLLLVASFLFSEPRREFRPTPSQVVIEQGEVIGHDASGNEIWRVEEKSDLDDALYVDPAP